MRGLLADGKLMNEFVDVADAEFLRQKSSSDITNSTRSMLERMPLWIPYLEPFQNRTVSGTVALEPYPGPPETPETFPEPNAVPPILTSLS